MNAPPPETRPPQPSIYRRWMDRILGGTHQHYRAMWPDRLGRLKSLLLKLFFSGIRLEEHQVRALKELPEGAILIFATKFSCLFSFLFAYTRYAELGLRFPQIGMGCRSWLWPPLARLVRVFLANLDSLLVHRRRPDPYSGGYLRDEFLKGRAGFLALIGRDGPPGFWRKPAVDPLEFLLDLQKTTDRPVLIVPQVIFFGRKPRRSKPSLMDMLFGPEEEPGRLRRLAALVKSPGNVFVEISPPVDLGRFIGRSDIRRHSSAYQAALLRGEILKQINRHRQTITGPVLKSRSELMESILSSERLQLFMQTYAEDHDLPLREVRAKVTGFLDEIAADINPSWIHIYSGIIGWILRTMYDGLALNPEEIAAVKRVSLRGPVVFVPSHKSHVDYLILSYVLYNHDMPCPLVAAGRNLSFWPIGPLFRRGGAFFIRRSFKGAVLYARAFSEYIHKILEEGYNVEQFIEGGRSRTGKLLMPKLGLLSILLNAYRNGACKELIFVPVSIGYDQILEEKSYLAEIEGETKKAESFLQFIQVPKFLRKRYGKIYLQLGEPISIREIEERDPAAPAEGSGRELNDTCRGLGHRISYAINRRSVVTPHALAATAILTHPSDRLTFEELLDSAEVYLNILYSVKARLADTLILDHRRALAHAVESYCQRKIIAAVDGDRAATGAGAGFLRIESKRPFLEYYKNSGIAFFVPAAFTAVSILHQDAFQFSAPDLIREYEFLQDLFQLEFVFDRDAPAVVTLQETLKTFMDEAILIPHPDLPDTYNLTSAGYRKLKLFALLLKTLLESYWVVLSTLTQTPRDGTPSKELSKKISARGTRMFRRKEIENREALSRVSFDNATAFFRDRGSRGDDGPDGMAAYAAAIQRALHHLRS